MRTLKDVDARSMSIVVGDPPNLAEISAVFPTVSTRFQRGIIFCYGDTIYNPCGRPIPRELLAHEATHSLQQRDYGRDWWWLEYLDNPELRLEWELEAHQIEYESYCTQGYGRVYRRRYLAMEAERLSGALYSGLLKKDEAKRLIKGGHNAKET